MSETTTRTLQFDGPELVCRPMTDGKWQWVLYGGQPQFNNWAFMRLAPEHAHYRAYIEAVN